MDLCFEILDEIFHYVHCGNKGAARDMVALAQTCRAFEDMALNILWHTQNNFVHLIKTLPPRCWAENPETDIFYKTFRLVTTVKGRPTMDEFTRFKSYASRIRRVSYLPYAHHKESSVPRDQVALRTLMSYHELANHSVFPNLRQLEFVDVKHAVGCLDIFLRSAKSISLSLCWSDCYDVGFNSMFRTLFRIIEEHALNMEELDLGSFQSGLTGNVDRDAKDVFSDLVCKMSELRGMKTGSRSLNGRALRHLASLPRLHTLQIPNTPEDILDSVQRVQSSRMVFSELQQLTMHVGDMSSFIRLVDRLKPLRLRALTLFVRPIPSSTDIHSLFSALQESTQHADFRRFLVKPSEAGQTQSSARRRGYVTIPSSMLDPLLSFKNMTVVELNLPYSFDVGDGHVRAMAEAWPRLCRLQLGSLVGWHVRSLVTCTGILSLVRGCRELEYLAVPFGGAGEFVPLRASLTLRDVNRKIRYLYVGNGEMKFGDMKCVARFLKFVFPRLCGIGGEWL
ncbi:hypothetical protein M413DRAFT_445624 [Hebeloma cylindrosporum]|uniref:F-box domain-containing protein n=1 Tax=Hebeloma cylindrosporum TaxID=76867 RepID=A0A0C2XT00_HEBCY|nr:hypothetical protein M413DRAFT_445624 [Hebeloma cylindrosporum h7]